MLHQDCIMYITHCIFPLQYQYVPSLCVRIGARPAEKPIATDVKLVNVSRLIHVM